MEIKIGSLVTNNQFYYKGKVFLVVSFQGDGKILTLILNDEKVTQEHLQLKDCELFKGKITLENKILVEESLILSAEITTANKLRKTKQLI